MTDEEPLPVEADEKKKPKAPKAPKPKKRPSDFEIIRTILTRTTERKLPFLLKNMGEDSDILLLCSEKEDEFKYGSSKMTIALFELTDPELKDMVTKLLEKLYGYQQEQQIVINLRDQISELSKTKGETMEAEVTTNEFGSAWVTKTDVAGKVRLLYFSYAVDSLFHFGMVKDWCAKYRPLLTTEDPKHLYFPYTHPAGKTYTELHLKSDAAPDHPLVALYPDGIRIAGTRGIDMFISKDVTEFPYPVLKEEMILFIDSGIACQLAHRITGEGWRALILRPNSIFIPNLRTKIPDLQRHDL